MNPVTVRTHGRLCVTYSFHEAPRPANDRLVVLHHGICHTRDQFLPLIAQLNARGMHAAMIDQQSEHAGFFRNCLGVKQYREGMAAAVQQIESETKRRVGSYAFHSMGALIGEEMQQKRPDLRRPTVLMAPIPVDGALPITLRIVRRRPLSYLKAVLTLDIHSLFDSPEKVRELLFDRDTLHDTVERTTAQLKHAPIWIYCQLVLRRLLLSTIHNDGLGKVLLYSDTDEIFHPREYQNTRKRYSHLEEGHINGGHDFFIEQASVTADRIAGFHTQHNP
jgi:pimeloyl-ACP methyl ester carboxylesterase